MVLGSWNPKSTICPFRARIWPFQAPKTLRFKGKMANLEATITIKQGKKHQKDKWYPFHACTGDPPKGSSGQTHFWGLSRLNRFPIALCWLPSIFNSPIATNHECPLTWSLGLVAFSRTSYRGTFGDRSLLCFFPQEESISAPF